MKISRVIKWIGILILTIEILIPMPWIYVRNVTSKFIVTDPARLSLSEVGIVFGASVYRSGRPSPALASRLDGAIELYHTDKIKKLLMSGDNSQKTYNEVSSMKKYAISKNVPEEAILIDPLGTRTYETCLRSKNEFKFNRAILVTQSFHINRAVYTCRQLGIEAFGYAIDEKFSLEEDVKNKIREIFAVINALWDLHSPKSFSI